MSTCDICGEPFTHVTTPGGFRGCDDHLTRGSGHRRERVMTCDWRAVHEPHTVLRNGVATVCAGIEMPYYLNKPDSHKTDDELVFETLVAEGFTATDDDGSGS